MWNLITIMDIACNDLVALSAAQIMKYDFFMCHVRVMMGNLTGVRKTCMLII